VWIRCGFWRTRKSTYNIGPSPPALALNVWLIYPLHYYSSL
jgi:hypothetical protein